MKKVTNHNTVRPPPEIDAVEAVTLQDENMVQAVVFLNRGMPWREHDGCPIAELPCGRRLFRRPTSELTKQEAQKSSDEMFLSVCPCEALPRLIQTCADQ